MPSGSSSQLGITEGSTSTTSQFGIPEGSTSQFKITEGSTNQFGVPPHKGDRQMVVYSGPQLLNMVDEPQLSNMVDATDVYQNDITVVPRSG
jgi:hypothetical protein